MDVRLKVAHDVAVTIATMRENTANGLKESLHRNADEIAAEVKQFLHRNADGIAAKIMEVIDPVFEALLIASQKIVETEMAKGSTLAAEVLSELPTYREVQ